MAKLVEVVAAALALAPTIAWADGGTLRVSRRSGSFQVTVFTAPTPLRAGSADISVLVQDASGRPRRDLAVTIRAWPCDHPEVALVAPATTAAATNKLFRAATLELSPGRWHFQVSLDADDATPSIAFEAEVGTGVPSWAGLGLWIGWPAAAVALYCMHRTLARWSRSRRLLTQRVEASETPSSI